MDDLRTVERQLSTDVRAARPPFGDRPLKFGSAPAAPMLRSAPRTATTKPLRSALARPAVQRFTARDPGGLGKSARIIFCTEHIPLERTAGPDRGPWVGVIASFFA